MVQSVSPTATVISDSIPEEVGNKVPRLQAEAICRGPQKQSSQGQPRSVLSWG